MISGGISSGVGGIAVPHCLQQSSQPSFMAAPSFSFDSMGFLAALQFWQQSQASFLDPCILNWSEGNFETMREIFAKV